MKHSQEKIIEALKVIRDICEENDDCCTCPFADGGDCLICSEESPEEWHINDNTSWKAIII